MHGLTLTRDRIAYLAPRAVLAQRQRCAAIPWPPPDDADWHADPHGACRDTGRIPSSNIEAAGGSARGPTKNACYPALARTHSLSDSMRSTPRASDPLAMSVHHDSLRTTIQKRRHPWRVGSFRLLIRSPMKSVDFGVRDSGTVENVAWHHRCFFSASTADQELQYRRLGTVGTAVRRQRIERTGMPQLSKVIGVATSGVKGPQIPMPPPWPRGVCAKPRRSWHARSSDEIGPSLRKYC
jgi:hypothetical protein